MSSRRVRFDIRQATQPLLIALAVLLVLNLGLYLGLVQPRVREWQALNQENSPRAQAFRSKQERVEALEEFVDGLKQARQDLNTLRSDVLSTREARMIDVQAELEALCRRHRHPPRTGRSNNVARSRPSCCR